MGFSTLLLLGALATTATTATIAVDEADWSARYVVRFVEGEDGAHRADVEGALVWNRSRGARPDDVLLSMADGYPGGYGAFVRGFEGGEVVSAEEGRYRLPVNRKGPAEFRYTIPLEHDPERGIGWDETPHAFSDGVLWTGRALFMTARDADATVVFEVRDGRHVTTSLAPVKGASGAYSAPNSRALTETYLVVGHHLERTIELPGTTFLLAVDGDAAAAADVLAEQVREYATAVIETFGGPPRPRCLVAITKAGGNEGGGAVHGTDAHVLVKGPPSATGPSDWRRTLCHELTHLWSPSLVGFDSREMWYGEGFTDYYTHLLLTRTGKLSGTEFLEYVSGWTGAYLEHAGTVGLREAGVLGAKNNTVIYQGGALAALCIDVSLRHASGNRRSLDDVMKTLYSLCDKNGGPVSIDELARLLDRHGGRALDGFLDRHVAGSEPLPLDEAFRRVGLALEEETVRIPEMDAVVPLLQCPGLTITSDGIRVDRTGSGKLKPGDHLVRVTRRAVSDFGDLRRALADAAPGDEVDVVVLRDGKRVPLELRLAGHGEALPSNEQVLHHLVPAKKIGRKARPIRDALFGARLR